MQHTRHSTKGKKRLSRIGFITPFIERVGSSVTFAMRKQLQAEHGKADLENQIESLEAKKKMQTNKIIELKSKIEAIDQRSASHRDVDNKKRGEENRFLKY